MRKLALALACCLPVAALVWLAACSADLPEPDSEGAKLYAQYCAGSGCHGPIPPNRDNFGYWQRQFVRMEEMMRRAGSPLPEPGEREIIMAWLERNALGAEGR